MHEPATEEKEAESRTNKKKEGGIKFGEVVRFTSEGGVLECRAKI